MNDAKPEHEWVTFHSQGTTPSGKTKLWRASGSGGVDDTIGHVKWSGAWRKYVFISEPAMLAPSCLRQIASFCDSQTQLKREHRARGGVVV